MTLYFQNLIVWQKAFSLAKNVHILIKSFPKEEMYALSDQLRRSSVSVMSNIAEWSWRNTTADRNHFYHMAKSSALEVASHLLVANEFWYIQDKELYDESLGLVEEIAKIIYTLVKT